MADFGVAPFERSDAGREWLERRAELVGELVEAWEIEPGEHFASGDASLALAVRRADGSEAVLKVGFPHRESEHEADALAVWDGDGAVRLLERDDRRGALLVERCRPGTPLSGTSAGTALGVLIALLPRLWKPAGEPIHTLADEAAWWITYLPDEWERSGRACERTLVDAAIGNLRELAPTQGENVLLHQDLHADNVLAAEREPWLAIDPKPLRGEREFAVAPIVRSFELGHGRRDVLHRFDRLTSELGLDRERARGWTIGQTMAWAFDSSYSQWHLETVRWLLEAA